MRAGQSTVGQVDCDLGRNGSWFCQRAGSDGPNASDSPADKPFHGATPDEIIKTLKSTGFAKFTTATSERYLYVYGL